MASEQVGQGTVVSTQPSSDGSVVVHVPGAPGNGSVTVRNLINTNDDCDFAARLLVEAFRGKIVHATSENSLPELIKSISLDLKSQNDQYFQRHFVAECNGERAGLLVLNFHGEPDPVYDEKNYSNIGCCDKCGLVCLNLAVENEKIQRQKCYIAQIGVDDKVRGKGIGKVLMERAEYEARRKGCTVIYLHVHTKNRAMHLYERQGFQVQERTLCCCCCLWCAAGIWRMARMDKTL